MQRGSVVKYFTRGDESFRSALRIPTFYLTRQQLLISHESLALDEGNTCEEIASCLEPESLVNFSCFLGTDRHGERASRAY